MLIDLTAPSGYDAASVPADDPSPISMSRAPKILVFDSGLGGLTVHAEVTALRPDADYLYVADDAGFPYGRWAEPELVARVVAVLSRFVASFAPDLVVIACNTASTLVLPNLRGAFPDVPFVGTVPAIKPAAALSRSKMISVLATPGTVARDYTRALVESFAADCRVIACRARRSPRPWRVSGWRRPTFQADKRACSSATPPARSAACFELLGEQAIDASGRIVHPLRANVPRSS